MDDVHLEGRPKEMCYEFSNQINEKITSLKNDNFIPVVICAGDIGEGLTGIEWAKDFKCDVIYVCGNHEFWGQDYYDEIHLAKQKVKHSDYSHIHFLHNETKIIHGTKFVGSTLWTNLGQHHKWKAKNYIIKYYSALGDFKRITAKEWYSDDNILKLKQFMQEHGVDNLKIEDLIKNKFFNPLIELEENKISVNFLKNELNKKFDGDTVVVTHHLPFQEPWLKHFKIEEDCLTKDYINEEKNFLEAAKGNLHSSKDLLMMGFYSNNLKSLIIDSLAPNYWVHGHLHQPIEDLIGKTKISSSPVGYLKQSNKMSYKEFSPENNKKQVSEFVKKEIENYSWNAEILDNLRGFETTIIKYEDIVKLGVGTSEDFQLIAQTFMQNHKCAKKEIIKQTDIWLDMFYYYQYPEKLNNLNLEDVKEKIGFNDFLSTQIDQKSKKLFSLSIAVNHYSFLSEEKFNTLNKNELHLYHYKQWLKELNLAQLNVVSYKKCLIDFCNEYGTPKI